MSAETGLSATSRSSCSLGVQVGGDAILKALSAAEYNAPDAGASAPVLQAYITVIRCGHVLVLIQH